MGDRLLALWKAAPRHEFALAEWHDGQILYHRPSGKTHLLNPAGAALLRELLKSPEEPFEADDALGELLLRFESLGLVERVPDR